MFEAVLLMCLADRPDQCRPVLQPGFAAPTRAACEAQAPDGAVCQPLGPVLEFEEIAPGVFAHLGEIAEPNAGNRGDVSNLGFVIGQDSVAVIDSGAARWIGEATWRAIRARTDKPVGHVILTHMHPDHVFGASVFAEAGAVVVGHGALSRALLDRQQNYVESLSRLIGPQVFIGTVAPEVGQPVPDQAEIDLGGRVLDLRAWPTAHTGTDLTVLDRLTSTLFTGDLVFHQHLPALDGRLRGWQQVLSEMRAWDVQRIVPGHGGPTLEWPTGSDAVVGYLDRLARDTADALAAGERLGDAIEHIATEEAAHWELFDAFNPRNATVAYTELEWE